MYGRNNNGPKAIIVRFQITQTEEVIKIIQVLISILLLEMLSILIKTLQTISASCLLKSGNLKKGQSTQPRPQVFSVMMP